MENHNYNNFNKKGNENKFNNEEKIIEKKVESLFRSLNKRQNEKNKTISVRVSELDYLMIKAKAKLLNVSMSDFLTEAARAKKVAGYDKVEDKLKEIFKK